jgi:predicted Zn-dependent protease
MSIRESYSFELSFFEGLHRRMPRDVRTVGVLAHLYTKVGRIDEGLRMDRKLVRLLPDDPTVHYNLACSLALKGRLRDATKALHMAIENGYEDYEWMRKDPDLSELQSYSAYCDLLSELGIR